MSQAGCYYITTPIYYVNDRPHIGHAYTTLACDVVARFMRLDGRDVMFLTGTDEHGQKVQKSAEKAGEAPGPFTDRVSENFRALARVMNYSNDDFIRPPEPRHVRACQAIWQAIASHGHIYLGKYAGWYSVRDEAFYGENELAERDGQRVAPSGATVEWVEEPSYFFRLSAWQERLLAFYEERPDFILPETRRNEVVSFVRSGLKDLSISRTSFDWGVPVPGDEAHIMYVWLDALTNYLTAIGYPDTDSDGFRRFWPADVHVVGKDILRFHAVYWPAFLMAAGLEPPRQVFAHGWLLNRGEKMSKSLGNVIAPDALKQTYGLDQSRYFLLREVPFGSDGYISHEAMVGRINGDLANDLGNLAQRVLSFVARHAGGAVPEPGVLDPADRTLLSRATALLDEVRPAFEGLAFHRALETIWSVIGDANRYIDEQAPWVLRRSDPERMATVLFCLLEALRRLAILIQPVMPDSMARLLDQLAVPADRRRFADLGAEPALVPGTGLPPPQGLFPRHVEGEEGTQA